MSCAGIDFFLRKSTTMAAAGYFLPCSLGPTFRVHLVRLRRVMLLLAAVIASISTHTKYGGMANASDSLARTKARTTARLSVAWEEPQDGEPKRPVAQTPRGIGVENVFAEGWGDTDEQALRDAFRNAIRQVLGAIVNAKTVVEEDRLVLDRIVTFSDGFIDYYKILETSVEAGRVHRRIMATVKKRDLTMHLRAERASASYDGRGLWPEAITKIERRQSAAELLKASLENYPWSCLEVSQKGLPKISRTLDNAAYLEPTILLRLDINRFNDRKRTLCLALDALSVASGTITSRLEKLDGNRRAALASHFEKRFFSRETGRPLAKQKLDFGQMFAMPCKQSELPKRIAEVEDKGGKLVVIGDGRKWTWYLVQETLDLAPELKNASVKFRDTHNRVIAERQMGLGPAIPGLSIHDTEVNGRDFSTVFFSPFFLDHAGSGYAVTMLAGCPGITLQGEIAISVDDLKTIEHVDVQIE